MSQDLLNPSAADILSDLVKVTLSRLFAYIGKVCRIGENLQPTWLYKDFKSSHLNLMVGDSARRWIGIVDHLACQDIKLFAIGGKAVKHFEIDEPMGAHGSHVQHRLVQA